MSNYPAGIGNYFSEQEEWERAIERAEERIIEEYGDGDLYYIEGEIFNEREALEIIDPVDDTIENYWIDREKMAAELAEGYLWNTKLEELCLP